MMSYDNYHNTTKVTTDPDPEYELVGDERNILLGAGCLVVLRAKRMMLDRIRA